MRRKITEMTASDWIDDFIAPSKYTNYDMGNTDLRQQFAHYLGKEAVLSDDDFRDSMTSKGYYPVDPDTANCHYKIKIASEWDSLTLLQRRLIPNQNEVLKDFILQRFPGTVASPKTTRLNSYYFSVPLEVRWHISRAKKQVVVTIWRFDPNVSYPYGRPADKGETIRLLDIKGAKESREVV